MRDLFEDEGLERMIEAESHVLTLNGETVDGTELLQDNDLLAVSLRGGAGLPSLGDSPRKSPSLWQRIKGFFRIRQ